MRAEDLPEDLLAGASAGAPRAASAKGSAPMRTKLEELERRNIEEALAAEGGNRTHAAERLGISRRALLYKLKDYGIDADAEGEKGGP